MEYLVGYWHELGLCGASGFGPAPLTFLEIDAWQRTTGLELTPWESLALRRLSTEYVSTLSKATRRTMLPPYRVDDIQARRDVVDQAWRELARAHASYDRHRNAKCPGND